MTVLIPPPLTIQDDPGGLRKVFLDERAGMVSKEEF
jgi:hypothetical protein